MYLVAVANSAVVARVLLVVLAATLSTAAAQSVVLGQPVAESLYCSPIMLRVRRVRSYRQMACRAGLEVTVNPHRPAMLLGVAAPVTVVSVAAAEKSSLCLLHGVKARLLLTRMHAVVPVASVVRGVLVDVWMDWLCQGVALESLPSMRRMAVLVVAVVAKPVQMVLLAK